MHKFYLFGFLLTVILCSSKFQKIVWLYWQNNIQQQPSVVLQVCVKKFILYTQKNNWKLQIVSDNNLHTFLPNQQNQQYLVVLQNSERQKTNFLPQAKSDLIRLFLLAQHGGVWFDISSLLFSKFSLQWLQNVQFYKDYSINKYTQQPEVLMFTFSDYQGTQIIFDSPTNPVNYHPGFQMWFIATAKNSSLMKEWKQQYIRFTLMGYFHYRRLLSQLDVFIRHFDCGGSYWSGNQALIYVLAQKQSQLDEKTTLFNLKSVFQYYGLWSIPGQFGPLFSSPSSYKRTTKLLVRTRQQLVQEYNTDLKFFIKINSPSRKHLDQDLSLLEQFNSKNLTIQSFLQSKPSQSQCRNLKFIVQGSIFQQQIVLESQEFTKKYHKAIITTQQRDKFQTYCISLLFPQQLQKINTKNTKSNPKLNHNVTLFDLLIQQKQSFYQNFMGEPLYSSGLNARIQLIQININNKLSGVQYISKYLQIHKFIIYELIFVLEQAVMYFFIFVLYQLVLSRGIKLLILRVNNAWMKQDEIQNYQNKQDRKISCQTQLKMQSTINLQKQTTYIMQMQKSKILLKNHEDQIIKKQTIKISILIILKIFHLLIGLLIIRCQIINGMRQFKYASLFFILISKISYQLLKGTFKSQQKLLQKIIRYINYIEQFMVTFCIFSFLFHRELHFVRYALIFSFAQPQLQKIIYDLKKAKIIMKLQIYFTKIKKFCEYFIICFILLRLTVFHNLTHIKIFQIYIRHLIAEVVNFILIIFYLAIGLKLILETNNKMQLLTKKQIKAFTFRLFFVGILYLLFLIIIYLQNNVVRCDQDGYIMMAFLSISVLGRQVNIQDIFKSNKYKLINKLEGEGE